VTDQPAAALEEAATHDSDILSAVRRCCTRRYGRVGKVTQHGAMVQKQGVCRRSHM